jgi:hypothetical protein
MNVLLVGRAPGYVVAPGYLVCRDADDHQPDAEQVLAGRELAKDDRADDRGEHREQREHEREAGAGQPGHG